MQLQPKHLSPDPTYNNTPDPTPDKFSCSELVFTFLVIAIMLMAHLSQPFLPGN